MPDTFDNPGLFTGHPAPVSASPASPTVKIVYTLSMAGQKSSMMSGGDGRRLQIVEVPATDELLAQAVVRKDGSSWIYLSHHFSNSELEELGLPLPDSPNGRHLVCPRLFGFVDDYTLKVTMEDRLQDHESYDFDAPLKNPASYVLDVPKLNEAEENRAKKRAAEMAESRDEPRRKAKEEEDRRSEEIAKSKAKAREREQIRLQCRDAWIREHGSGRLKKLLEADLLDLDITLYDKERIALELGDGWILGLDEHDASPIEEAPAEHELDALLVVRKRWPEDRTIQLMEAYDLDEGRQGVTVARFLSWDPRRLALKFVHPPVPEASSSPSPSYGSLPRNRAARSSLQKISSRKKTVRKKAVRPRKNPRKQRPKSRKDSGFVDKWTKAIKKIK